MYKKLLLTISSFIIVAALLFTSCNNEGVTEADYHIKYNRTAQLENVYHNEIIMLSKEFKAASNSFLASITRFKQSNTIENLLITQEDWRVTLTVWKQLELYNLSDVEDSFIHFEINRWPTNTEVINEYINGNTPINEVFIATKGSSAKGLSALEYLLFSSKDNQEVLNTFTTSLNFKNRLDYLLVLSQNLATKSDEILTIWQQDETDFITGLENGISGTQNQLTNAMITLIEEVIISKLGNPLGDNTGGIINTNALEASRSTSSLIIIKEHLTALKRCYTGSFIKDTFKWGFDDYLKLITTSNLDATILNAFTNCENKISLISSSLENELETDSQKVTDLQDAFRDLLVLIKVDMANAIGTTVTINDNDGD